MVERQLCVLIPISGGDNGQERARERETKALEWWARERERQRQRKTETETLGKT